MDAGERRRRERQAARRKQTKKKERHKAVLQFIKSIPGRIGTLNIVLILMGLFFVWFNSQMLEIFRIYGSIPETYAVAVVGATIGECGICGWIRTNKDKAQDRKWKREDKEEEPEPEPSQAEG